MIHEISKRLFDPDREENPQARVPRADGQSRPLAGAGRFDRVLLPLRQNGASTLFGGDSAAHALFATVVHHVCPVQFVDGEEQFVRGAGMSASAGKASGGHGQRSLKGFKNRCQTGRIEHSPKVNASFIQPVG